MGSLVAELAEKLSSATNSIDFDEQTLFLNTSANTVGVGTNAPASKFDVRGTMQVGLDDTGYDVKFFGDTASRYWLWDTSADGVVQRGTLSVGVDDTGHDVKFFGATAGAYWLWDESADGVVQIGTLTVGVDDAGHDVKFFGATASKYWLWDESADQTVLIGSSTQTGNAQLTGTLTVGVDDTGHDVKFFGATATNGYMLWDESTDDLILGSSSNLGIGTTAPSAPLDVVMSHTDTTVANMSSNETLELTNSGAVNGAYNAIGFHGNQQSMFFASFNHATQASRRLGFFVGSVAGDAAGDERISIMGDGKVGIGTTAPSSQLEIINSSTAVLRLEETSGCQAQVYAGGSSMFVGTRNSTNVDIATNGGTRLTITSAGSFQFAGGGSSGFIDAPGLYHRDLTGDQRVVYVEDGGNVGTTLSTRKAKTNIVDMETPDWIYNLRPVNFRYKKKDEDTGEFLEEPEGSKQYGLIAEEVDEVEGAETMVYSNTEGVVNSVEYSILTTILLKAVQDLNTKVTALQDA